ncbi:MAG: 16S rRNA (cytidine(1402)-2'-O)-methyltransferase [Legionellaceae bacterium]|nr:16S rRNA (cytidine(1402)-2'-O)-methyltransferase [Legionellaceae bacterium]|tara:strand:- start:1014 stop:1859 length:846 start_codon:yes stop_codon:yes gene_type:complete
MTTSAATSLAGCLYIVATPIGNAADLTYRAHTILQQVDYILAEDTRHSRPLLKAYNIQTPVQSLHEHNEAQKSTEIIAHLLKGCHYALISDAGTPLISDPGFHLVKSAREAGIAVVPIPGACAIIAALCASGLPCDTFLFTGFLPAKPLARHNKLKSLEKTQTTVLYESTHRIHACIEDIRQIYGEHYQFVLAKELTKKFEHFKHGTADDLLTWLNHSSSAAKGEFVLILPAQAAKPTPSTSQALLAVLLAELPLKQAVKIASLYTKEPKNQLYELALKLK